MRTIPGKAVSSEPSLRFINFEFKNIKSAIRDRGELKDFQHFLNLLELMFKVNRVERSLLRNALNDPFIPMDHLANRKNKSFMDFAHGIMERCQLRNQLLSLKAELALNQVPAFMIPV